MGPEVFRPFCHQAARPHTRQKRGGGAPKRVAPGMCPRRIPRGGGNMVGRGGERGRRQLLARAAGVRHRRRHRVLRMHQVHGTHRPAGHRPPPPPPCCRGWPQHRPFAAHPARHGTGGPPPWAWWWHGSGAVGTHRGQEGGGKGGGQPLSATRDETALRAGGRGWPGGGPHGGCGWENAGGIEIEKDLCTAHDTYTARDNRYTLLNLAHKNTRQPGTVQNEPSAHTRGAQGAQEGADIQSQAQRQSHGGAASGESVSNSGGRGPRTSLSPGGTKGGESLRVSAK